MKGDPPFEITWKKDGRKLDSNDGIIILRSGQRLSILNIESTRARHAGNYTCQVKSQAGIIEYSAELHVSGTFTTFISDHCSYFLYDFSPTKNRCPFLLYFFSS